MYSLKKNYHRDLFAESQTKNGTAGLKNTKVDIRRLFCELFDGGFI